MTLCRAVTCGVPRCLPDPEDRCQLLTIASGRAFATLLRVLSPLLLTYSAIPLLHACRVGLVRPFATLWWCVWHHVSSFQVGHYRCHQQTCRCNFLDVRRFYSLTPAPALLFRALVQAQRKIKSEAYYVDKKAAKQLKDKATAEANLAAVAPVLEEYGF